ncbi:MBL fold metallo-hydrolase [Patescibacteria group bacterium]|nr:MBL fold metallo-hydrolase [Patescibacteria group bacterium]MCG2694796.1 MBL fold metallo-hydrolase [Candidatus Parcubacteria bacterium]
MKNIKSYVLGFFLCVNLLVWYAVFSENRGELTVAFLDVGQGDAIFIEAPNGKQILIDGGSNGAVLRELSKIMPFYDRSIDMIILSHPDQDHIGGLPAVLENYKVDYVMESGIKSDSGTYETFENIIEEKAVKKILAQQGMVVSLCDSPEVGLLENSGEAELPQDCGGYLEVLFPNVDVSDFETNTSSIVIKLVYGENSFLFTGDAPQSIEKYLADSFGNYLDVDVLKLGHHGSKNSNSEKLLGFASPEYTIASVGLGNSYGHPSQEVLNLLKQFEIDLLRTDEEGMVIFKSDGQSLKIEN